MIKIQQVSKSFGGKVKALQNVDLHIGEGEFVALLGPSGAGKSTLLRCINGLVRPCRGTVEVDGISVHSSKMALRKVRSQTGMIFQQFNLVKRLKVIDNVLCGRLAYSNIFTSSIKMFPRSDVEFALYCLERVGLADKAYQRADQLSGGQQQRVGIARALVQTPKIILADEPVASLDPRSSLNVMNILKKINQEDGITIVVSLHDLDLARQFADRMVGIKDGTVVVDKGAKDLSRQEIEEIYRVGKSDGYSADFLGKVELVHA
ncbi:MAG: phosphonate ABC transporter ATP-binding protein [Candidatus Aquicultor sp.]|nr:phosphonate ABC transporter ATP-binding protein [Candidatus Aquicultor sp.]